ncbi:hypothetical protein [Variovorax sp. KK3]|uniref:hypothetical protein n=1 Tax=Variovorax sp. KK3 TaxID=1855728 RepID=UPI00097BD8FE|nr:hypothetical protein [Variovorax sp. KK3]
MTTDNDDELHNIFREAVEDYCRYEGIDDIDAVLAGAIIVRDSHFLRFELLHESALCRILITMPRPPDEVAAEASAWMLRANFDEASDYLLMFSLHPDTGDPVLMLHVPPHRLMEADSIGEAVDAALEEIDRWEALIQKMRQQTSADPHLFLSP